MGSVATGSVIVVVISLFYLIFGLITERVKSLTSENDEPQDSALFLTQLLEGNEILKAQHLSRVHPDIENTASFTGYFTVDRECESNLFFWFCQAQTNWEESPVLLWLQGGPGSSSLFGLFEEIGPFFYEGKQSKRREISWNKNINLLFIDQPVGTGFSFTNKSCYAKNKTDIARHLYSAIEQFFLLFPILKGNSFFIAGESYAGHYIPYIAHHIHQQNSLMSDKIKLSGLMIGNGWMDSYHQSDYGDFMYSLGLIDSDQKKTLQDDLIKHRQLLNAMDKENAMNIQIELETKKNTFFTDLINPYNYMQGIADVPRYENFMDFSFLRKQIHVGSNSFGISENIVYDEILYDQIVSVKSEVEELLEHYPVLFYFGQLDTICPYSVGLGFLRTLRWSGTAEFRHAQRRQWCVNGQLAGFYKSSHNLHEVLLRNAGHSVPLDQPLWAFLLVDSFTSSPPENPLQRLDIC